MQQGRVQRRTRCHTLRTPFTVCVLPVPGGPWISTNGTGGMPWGAGEPRCAAANCRAQQQQTVDINLIIDHSC
jgi:hypothetical protein